MTQESDLHIEGKCDAIFSDVRNEFEKNFLNRNEIGAAVAVYKDGKKVVDLWGGYKDVERTVPWEEDTIVVMNSITKSMCALCVHILIDRGKVDFNAPVATYWPKFAQANKQDVLVRHVLSHSCGVIYCDDSPTEGTWFDWDSHIAALEKQEPAWKPGESGAYNSINIGYLLGEIVRRVDGRTVGQFLREEVTQPLGADYNLGLKHDEIARLSDMHENPANGFFKMAFDSSTPLGRAFKSMPPGLGFFQNIPQMREMELPSFGGHGNARAMARIYAMLAGNGEVGGVRLLSDGAVEQASQLAWEHDCIMTRRQLRMGYGFMHNEPSGAPMGENMKAFGHTGSGGAFTWCDRERNLAFAYCTNFQRDGVGIGPRGALLSIAVGGGDRPDWWQ